jgi:hypothetical protein
MSADPQALLEDRIDTAVARAYGTAGYLTDGGDVDTTLIADKITELVLTAEVNKKNERAAKCITRRALMQHVFPRVPGPEDWAEQEDPEVAQGVYVRLDSLCWRLTAISPESAVQSRLNSEHALVLCRTKVNPHRTDAVYTTRDLGCLLEDIVKPQRAAQKKRGDRDAALTAMLIERVPEHGKRFDRELVGGLQTALDSAKAITAGALETALAESEAESGEDEAEGDA